MPHCFYCVLLLENFKDTAQIYLMYILNIFTPQRGVINVKSYCKIYIKCNFPPT